MNPRHLHILQHSLGLDEHGQGTPYRNHYATGPECDSYADCQALAALGLMKDHGKVAMWGNLHGFTVTDEGKVAVRLHSPKPPKLTRGQKLYREFLDADCSMEFGEYLRWRWANRHEIAALAR